MSETPQHVAIIMDGNRRWARQQGLAIIKGHRKVAEEMIERLADFAIEKGIKYLTLWAFSTENWNRAEDEVKGLMDLFRETFETSSERFHKKGVQVATIGDLSRFPEDIRQGVEYWVEETAKNEKLTVTFALNYGGRDEILRAAKKMIKNARAEQWSESMIDDLKEADFEQFLDTKNEKELPDVDLLIRPGGEERLSGYLPWQSTYAELYFTDVLMPDFDEAQFEKALEEFSHRQRRFGK
jgi:undecaprenyl diphosphate synthase